LWKRIKFPTFWYNCYYFIWSDTYFIQLETLLINHPSYNLLFFLRVTQGTETYPVGRMWISFPTLNLAALEVTIINSRLHHGTLRLFFSSTGTVLLSSGSLACVTVCRMNWELIEEELWFAALTAHNLPVLWRRWMSSWRLISSPWRREPWPTVDGVQIWKPNRIEY